MWSMENDQNERPVQSHLDESGVTLSTLVGNKGEEGVSLFAVASNNLNGQWKTVKQDYSSRQHLVKSSHSQVRCNIFYPPPPPPPLTSLS